MALIEGESSDLETIKKIKELISSEFDSKVSIKEKDSPKGKWTNFANRMSGLTNSNITEHIIESSKEMRESFEFRDLLTKK